MSHLLWKYYLEDDLERFKKTLANAGHQVQHSSKSHTGWTGHTGSFGSSSPYATSPKNVMKARKVSGHIGSSGGTRGSNVTVGKAEINSRDHAGTTILHRVASSTAENALSFAMALIEHPLTDLYVQDLESGWTALHRALYSGNITIARAIMHRDRQNSVGLGNNLAKSGVSVIKVKDFEGNSPFDVYNASIARRTLQHGNASTVSESGSESGDNEVSVDLGGSSMPSGVDGHELFVFGSNKNHSLGFPDGDDRQHPEKLTLKRPDHLFFLFYQEYLASQGHDLRDKGKPVPKSLNELPCLILNRPIVIHDVVLSKLHSAILTTDPEANLYMCGFGSGGRLGTGDELTRFSYTCVEEGAISGKQVASVALGQNHTLAISSTGEIFSWGTSTYGQLGYNLPHPAKKDEEPFCATPRQIFGLLKRERILGIAASAIHSVAHTSTSLYCWGKNDGQLGLMDSDSRSLAIQPIPRKVAASLFKAPIKTVSAINGATICLLANYTVCVFTNYGYNKVQFPLYGDFSNSQLSNSLSTRYDQGHNHISYITAGGDTIAAVSSRGDLFTLGVRKMDSDGPSASTTNPSKIKSSLTTPQKIWSLRKGNWDGIKSVGVAENGSVMVCTQAGAVWRRIKRPKVKDSFTTTSSFSRKDFKFQRVAGLTNVTVVRSTPFGVYAAVRRDCDVTRTQIHVEKQSLWEDVRPMLSVNGIASLDLVTSKDIEVDIKQFLLKTDLEGYNVEIGTTTSDTYIPAHGFMMSARSTVLRKAFSEFHQTGSAIVPEILLIERSSDQLLVGASAPSIRLTFQGLDLLTVFNLVLYLYTDTVVDFWHYTQQHPAMAFRYRQGRIELMRTAIHLKLSKLEIAVRLMTEPEKSMDLDMNLAVHSDSFFEDGDTIIELDGDEISAHSQILCRRCPFFDGLFNGRSGGQWLTGRREPNAEAIRIDLKHMDPGAFEIALRYLYADMGIELFNDIVSDNIDEFSELVMDVMSIANELMIDRLSQICQEVIGRFVNPRNVSQLLNLVAPCSITGFKDATLEYLCLQLEYMLENHLIDDLDEDLMLDLDQMTRENQLNCLPFAKSGRAEMLLHERHPNLAGEIDEERQRRIRDMVFRANLKDDDSRLSASLRATSLDDHMPGSPSQDKLRRKSKTSRNAPFSPSIRPKASTNDLIFDMDEEESPASRSPMIPSPSSKTPVTIWDERDVQETLEDDNLALSPRPISLAMQSRPRTPPSTSARMWSSPALSSSKLDMKEIMAQASSNRVSNLSASLSAARVRDENTPKSVTKLSQKERKKQQQEALQRGSPQPKITLENPDGKSASPWQLATTGRKTTLKDVLNEAAPSPLSLVSGKPSPSIPAYAHRPRRTASPDTRFAGQHKSNSNNKLQQSNKSSQPRNAISPSTPSPIIPHSKTYTSPVTKAEPSLQLSMSDIIVQQRREQEVLKEAVAKRSLQEIQEEQAFQEWWDQESKRAQEEEVAKAKSLASKGASGSGSTRGGRGGRGDGGRGRGDNKGDGGRVGKGKRQKKNGEKHGT
ncbi:hypothetical protein B0O99DRAFT_502175 [Bisporella sp. PMI_857]|nr:hypothetical protein B0O99DRAFT_502175 [Bisporella sp. PMI_857]